MIKISPKYLNFENISKKCIRVLWPLHRKFFLSKTAICKTWHWNLGIGIGIAIGTDITNAIISSSIRSMDPKVSRVVT